jgi:hypothetical protein
VVEASEVKGTANTVAPQALEVTITEHPITLQSYVRGYFKDAPILAEIAKCESTFRQFDKNGNVLRGKVNSDDIGIMQINKYYHQIDAEKLGFDIYTLEGNLAYAKWLYGKYGDKPWVHSSPCWSKYSSKIALK